jgi:hypothetical protein
LISQLEGTKTVAQEALLKARDHLLGLQRSQGSWRDEIESNVSIEAEDHL